jgi:hypothetical protein
VIILIALTWLPRGASGDCGGIPFKPHVQVFEPDQRAVIAYNGREEILLLSTDLRASEPTKVLQVLPLPSEPKVSKGDDQVFVKATNLINERLGRPLGGSGGMGGFGGAAPRGRRDAPAGEVTFHDKIGSHEISVTHVLDRQGFITWVEDYLRKAGVDNPKIPEPMKDVVAEYLRDQCQWFVFDVVELGSDLKTKEAIQYRFKTAYLYYPLRITRTEEGDTSVRLLILSPELVRIPRLGKIEVRLPHEPLRISVEELESLGSADLADLLPRRPCMLRIWEVSGPLSGFTQDIVTSSRPE